MSREELATIAFSLSSSVTFLTLCLFTWCIIELRRHWREQYFVKRRPILVLTNLCGWMIFCINHNFFYDQMTLLTKSTFWFDVLYFALNTFSWFAWLIYCIRVWYAKNHKAACILSIYPFFVVLLFLALMQNIKTDKADFVFTFFFYLDTEL